jgi:hypothetical protein
MAQIAVSEEGVMRKPSILGVIPLATVVVMMLAAPATAGRGPMDGITGGFEDHFGERVGLRAYSGPNGEEPGGHESATRPEDTRYRMTVVCLAVSGHTAAYGTVITHSNNPDFPVGFEFTEVVRDGGPGGADDGWDIFDGGAHECELHLADAAGAPPIGSGDITVTDS